MRDFIIEKLYHDFCSLFFLFSLSILLLLPFVSFSGPQSSYQKKYVTARGLYVRTAPNIKAKIINMIPAGTLLRFKKTAIKQKIGKYNACWYALNAPLKGYVYGVFLSVRRGAAKRLVLCSESYNREYGCRTKIILSSGYAIKIVRHHNTFCYEVHKGVYTVMPTGIQLFFRQHSVQFSVEEQEKHRMKYVPGYIRRENKKESKNNGEFSISVKMKKEKLSWMPRFKGFVVNDYVPHGELNKTKTGMLSYCAGDVEQEGFLTDRLWFKFNLPKESRQFMYDNKWK